MVEAPRPRNRRGDPIDPVPFLVTTGLAFTVVFSFGPIYGLAYGLSLRSALALSGAAFAGATALAHRQLVRSAPALDAGPLPPGPRVERLFYGAVALGVALVALTLPLL
ncbi:hypothetical protein [Halorubrum sp. Atlit-26R]|uniref:hypothetical protein n=1 Tax=Halorubrum sp. Atlit-26R TaxID=2282128 RepID=UPI000EF18A9A|nr:hypothetical protein [Halorubrum sp. Atlit-26R]RLM62761.1 hypothetical protein DVK07_17725 [Halorubrum sp. Atlit-26R]